MTDTYNETDSTADLTISRKDFQLTISLEYDDQITIWLWQDHPSPYDLSWSAEHKPNIGDLNKFAETGQFALRSNNREVIFTATPNELNRIRAFIKMILTFVFDPNCKINDSTLT